MLDVMCRWVGGDMVVSLDLGLALGLGRALVGRARSFLIGACRCGMRRSGLFGVCCGLGGLGIVFLGGRLCLILLGVVDGRFCLR